MESFESQPDDPALKLAIRRALGSEAAPAALRERIQTMLATEQRKQQTRSKLLGRRPVLLGMISAAAMVLIGLGVAYMLMDHEKPMPQWFAKAMVAAHEASLANNNVLPGLGPNASIDAIRQGLRAQVGHPVLVAMLNNGWKFQGAGIEKISGVPAAHLLFTRGTESISIFSVSAGAFYMNNTSQNGMTYAQVEQGHPISGFLQGGAIHCLVGSSKSGELSLKEVTRLRDQLRGDVAVIPAEQEILAQVGGSCH